MFCILLNCVVFYYQFLVLIKGFLCYYIKGCYVGKVGKITACSPQHEFLFNTKLKNGVYLFCSKIKMAIATSSTNINMSKNFKNLNIHSLIWC